MVDRRRLHNQLLFLYSAAGHGLLMDVSGVQVASANDMAIATGNCPVEIVCVCVYVCGTVFSNSFVLLLRHIVSKTSMLAGKPDLQKNNWSFKS